jgi:tripartite-type tricarboxylate transporter receptor subunit TctC
MLKALAAGGAASLAGAAFAQEDKSPIRMLCGIAAGSGNDFTARLVADRMREALGRPVVVENRPGAGQRIALAEVRRSPPDGRTLILCTTGPFTIYPHIYTKLDYEPFRDFTPVAAVASFDVGIATGPQMKAKSMQELIAMARADKSYAAYGSPGPGSLSHFVGISMGIATGIALTHVPYKDSGVSVVDLASGRLPMLITGVSQMVEQHRAGRIRILAVSGSHRSPQLPDVPTLRESGINVSNTTTCGVFGRAGLPPALVQKLGAVAMQAVQSADAKERLGKYLFDPAPAAAQELAALMVEEDRLFERLVKVSGYVREPA